MRDLRPLVGIFALLLCGCPPATLLANRPVIDVRSPDHLESHNDASYAYVVFARAPRSTNRSDYELCDALLSHLRDRKDSSVPVSATYWPTKRYIEPSTINCNHLLDEYDIDFADLIRNVLPSSRNWEVFLYAQAPGAFGTPPRTRICVDLSGMRSDSDLDTAMLQWQNLMREGPETWQPLGLMPKILKILTLFRQRGNVYEDCGA